MAGITGQGTAYNLPNYVGELFALTPQDTPFLSAIGGLTGGKPASDTTVHTWQTFDLRDAADDRQRLEGANAPTAEARVRAVVRNVLEIHQEALELSYTKIAATGQYASTGSSNTNAVGAAGVNPVTDEIDFQVRAHIAQVARDVEASFITGTFQDPANNSTARKTRGILAAITTNAVDASGAQLDDSLLLDLMQDVWANGGIMEQGTASVMVNGYQKRRLTKVFVKDAGYRQDSRTVGGVRVDTIITDFGELNVMLNRHMPADSLAVVSLEQCAPVFLEIPGKGHFFVEALAKQGAAERFQLYGEIGLEYGNQAAHGKITGLATSVGSGS
jgi:hypothetical protein